MSIKKRVAMIAISLFVPASALPALAETSKQIEKLEHSADDAEHSRNYLAALASIDQALQSAKSMGPYDEKVTELRARHLRYLLLTKPFKQFQSELSKFIDESKLIEKNMREEEAIVEINNLYSELLPYAVKNSSEDAFKLVLRLTEAFKKCGFYPCKVIVPFAQFYIRNNNFKPLEDLGKQYIQYRTDPSLFGHYILYLSYERTGRKKEASASLSKLMTEAHAGHEYEYIDGEYHLARAMNDSLQYDAALQQADKTIKHLTELEAKYDKSKGFQTTASYLTEQARCLEIKCSIGMTLKNYNLALSASKLAVKCLDDAAKRHPALEEQRTFKDTYKTMQGYEEAVLRAQGKNNEADRVRTDRLQRRFGIKLD